MSPAYFFKEYIMTAAAGTLVTTRAKINQTPNEDVWEVVITYSVVSGDTTGTIALPLNGIIRNIVYVTPDTANNDLTSTMTIADNSDNAVFTTGAGIAENTTNLYSVDVALSGTIDVALAFNEDVGVSADFTVTLRGI